MVIHLDLVSAASTGAKLVTNCHDLHWLRLKGGASAPHNPHPLNQGVVHLHVPCRSICDWDQNLIQPPFWEPIKESRLTSKLRKSKAQERMAPIQPLTCKKSSDQAHFLPVVNFETMILVANVSTGDIQVITPWWMPIQRWYLSPPPEIFLLLRCIWVVGCVFREKHHYTFPATLCTRL